MAFWVAPRAQRPSTRHGRGAQLLCLPLSAANSGGFTLEIYPESHNFSPPPAYHPGPSRRQLKSSFHSPCGLESSPFQEPHSGQCSPVTSLTFWMILEQEASHFHFALGPANMQLFCQLNRLGSPMRPGTLVLLYINEHGICSAGIFWSGHSRKYPYTGWVTTETPTLGPLPQNLGPLHDPATEELTQGPPGAAPGPSQPLCCRAAPVPLWLSRISVGTPGPSMVCI